MTGDNICRLDSAQHRVFRSIFYENLRQFFIGTVERIEKPYSAVSATFNLSQ